MILGYMTAGHVFFEVFLDNWQAALTAYQIRGIGQV